MNQFVNSQLGKDPTRETRWPGSHPAACQASINNPSVTGISVLNDNKYLTCQKLLEKEMIPAITEAYELFAQMEGVQNRFTAVNHSLEKSCTSCIEIKGTTDWVVNIHIEAGLMQQVMKNIVGEDVDDASLVQDMTNEFANLIGGGFKSKVSIDLILGLPVHPDEHPANFAPEVLTSPYRWMIETKLQFGLMLTHIVHAV